MLNWSLKGEALYWDLGSMNANAVASHAGAAPLIWGRTSVNSSGVLARAGIN